MVYIYQIGLNISITIINAEIKDINIAKILSSNIIQSFLVLFLVTILKINVEIKTKIPIIKIIKNKSDR